MTLGIAFTPREIEQLSRLPMNQRRPMFFRLWTRKEALLKALGTGLSTEMSRLELGLPTQDAETVLLAIPGKTASSEWWFSEIPVGGEVSAVSAVPGPTGTLVLNLLE